ncbi:MAG: GWxTD domain-containing protein [Bacteroidota bacterium]|nr:GWxTD domain-containing protein [Bacteroidota bacterium]
MRFCFSKYGLITFVLYATVLAGCSSGYNTEIECYSTTQFRKHSLPSFSTYLMNVRSENDSRVDIYLQMPYRNLRFERVGDGYKASFSVTFIIRNEGKEIVQTKELDRSIFAKNYEESVSSRFDASLQSFVLKPSEYGMEIVSIDNLSQLRYKQSTRLEVKKFPDSIVTASTILLLDTVIADENGLSLRPVFPASLSRLKDNFGIFQELYNVGAGDTVKIIESYFRSKQQNIDENSFVYFTPPYRVKMNMCSDEVDSMYYKMDSTFIVKKNGLQQLIQFYPLPSDGYNKLDRTIIISNKSSSDTIRLSNNYFLRDKMLQSSPSFQEITNTMRYILREAEYDSLAIAEGEGRNIRINQFWETHGGLERRKEFEQRMREANILFTECINGAETPMGIVFIICGIPDYIECRGGSMETWFYTIGERSFPIEFRRENENIAYYTMLPFSVNDSLWQYFVDRWRRK